MTALVALEPVARVTWLLRRGVTLGGGEADQLPARGALGLRAKAAVEAGRVTVVSGFRVHSCGTVPPHGLTELAHPEPNVYLVGMKSYGRAPTFLARTGYEQVRSIAVALAGDRESAELVLPQTGVSGAALTPAR